MAANSTLQPLAAVVGGSHYLHVAPLGTPLPTDVPAPGGDPHDGLDSAFMFGGATADSGASFSIETQTQDLFVSQLLDPYRTIVQSRKATLQAPLVDWTAEAFIIACGGGDVTTTANGYEFTPPPSGEIDEVTAVLTILDGGEFYRFVVERGIVGGSIQANLVKNNFSTLPITLTALAPVDMPSAWSLITSNDAMALGS